MRRPRRRPARRQERRRIDARRSHPRPARQPDGRVAKSRVFTCSPKRKDRPAFSRCAMSVRGCIRANRFHSTRRAGKFSALPGWSGPGVRKSPRPLSASTHSPAKEIFLDGEEIPIHAPRDAIEHGICLVPENRRTEGLIVEMSVRENVTLPSLHLFRAAA